MSKPHDRFAYHLQELHKVLQEYIENTHDETHSLHWVAMVYTFMALDTMRNYAVSDPKAVQFFNEVRNKTKTHFKKGGQFVN
jgi:hypothetical protein